MRPGGVDAGVERHVGALERVEGEGAHHVRAADEAQRLGDGEAAHRGHELGPVDEGEALLRLEDERDRPYRAQGVGGGQAAALEDALALADEGEREVGEGREVPARPDRPLRGDDGVDAAIDERDQQLEGLEAHAGEALGQHVGPQQHERSRLGFPEGGAHSRRVGAEQVELELPQAIEGDVDVGEVAEAGGDTVDHRAARHRLVHHAPRRTDRRACRVGERDGSPVAGDRFEPRQVERLAVDREGRGRGGDAHGVGTRAV